MPQKYDLLFWNQYKITRKVSSARFFSVLEDRKGNLWFGSVGSGVYYYDGISFQNFTTKEGLLNNEVLCIYEDKKGNIWFGVSGGASRYDGKSFRNYIINGDAMNEDRIGKTFLDRPPKSVLGNYVWDLGLIRCNMIWMLAKSSQPTEEDSVYS